MRRMRSEAEVGLFMAFGLGLRFFIFSVGFLLFIPFRFYFYLFFFALGSLAPWGLAFVKMHLWSYFVVVLLLPFLRVWLCVCAWAVFFFIFMFFIIMCAEKTKENFTRRRQFVWRVCHGLSILPLSLYPITHPISERSATKAATFPIHFCRDSTFTDLT